MQWIEIEIDVIASTVYRDCIRLCYPLTVPEILQIFMTNDLDKTCLKAEPNIEKWNAMHQAKHYASTWQIMNYKDAFSSIITDALGRILVSAQQKRFWNTSKL